MLLEGGERGALEQALWSLLVELEAGFAFFQCRTDDQDASEQGAVVMAVAVDPAFDVKADRDYYASTPWSRLPSVLPLLDVAPSFTLAVDQLPAAEADVLLQAPTAVRSVLTVPIRRGGRYRGALNLMDRRHRGWRPEHHVVAEAAGSMVGAWWDREVATARLRAVLAEAQERLVHERALARCSQALLLSDDESGLQEAVEALLDATNATTVFVERNIHDPVVGLCSQVVCWAPQDSTVYDPRYWDRMPWEKMPWSFERLSRGEPAVLSRSVLTGAERETYLGSTVGSEIDVPVMVDGEWVGTVGFVDHRLERGWEAEQDLLTTAAGMIGAFWQRKQAAARLEEMVRSKDQFLAAVSHELRTPLTAVVGMAEVLKERAADLLDPDTAELVALIADQGAEMANLIEDLLVAARIEIGAVAVVRTPVELGAQAAAVLRGLRISQVAVEGPAVRVTGDPVRVRQVTRTLVSNARRYGGEALRVRLGVEGQRGWVEVCDDGPGVPEHEAERIFQPYYRRPGATETVGAVGLGLTISRHLARLMGGDISYRRREGWTCFRLELPLDGLRVEG